MGLVAADGGLTGLEFQTYAVIEGVTLGLLYFDQYILFPLTSFRILHRSIDLAENTEVIEALLGLQHVDLAQWVARFHL